MEQKENMIRLNVEFLVRINRNYKDHCGSQNFVANLTLSFLVAQTKEKYG